MKYYCKDCHARIKIHCDDEGECLGECLGCKKLFTDPSDFRNFAYLGLDEKYVPEYLHPKVT